MIAVRALEYRVGDFALRDISLEVPGGAYGVLMGCTGSGKTSILEAICGLRPIVSGRVFLRGRDVTGLKAADRGVGYVPQDLAIFPRLTVEENIAFALTIRRWPAATVRARVEEVAALLGIERLLARRPAGLSGGEAQRVALGRAIAFSPAVLCLDEPLSALDEGTRDATGDLLKRVQERTGVTVLHVTHSRREAEKLADTVLHLEGGLIRAAGPAASGGR